MNNAALPSTTIAIASRQRCSQLRRLVEALRDEIAGSPALQDGLDVVVVLDGSSDGSAEMLEGIDFPAPLRVIAQSHRGSAATRNSALRASHAEIILFLDDDLVPEPSLVLQHRRAQRERPGTVVIGACPIPSCAHVPVSQREWWALREAELAAPGVIDRFDLVTFANTSAPVRALQQLGGFDESFVEYGYEDYELGARLLEAGITVRFEASAVAWHAPAVGFALARARQRSMGHHAVLLAQTHPAIASDYLRNLDLGWPTRILCRLGQLSPKLLTGISGAAVAAAGFERLGAHTFGRRATQLALTTSYLAGVAEADPQGGMARVLGRA